MKSWTASLIFGFTMTVLQVIVLLLLTGGNYTNLVHFDAAWYRDIAVQGYQVQLPLQSTVGHGSRIAFFPAFPVYVSWLHQCFKMIFGFDRPDFVVTFAAQTMSVAVWTYVFKMLGELGLALRQSGLIALGFACLPAAYYLVVGYSESLFTSSLLGFVYWTHRSLNTKAFSWKVFLLAAIHGYVVTATRLLGLVVMVYPLCIWAFSRRSVQFWKALGLSLAACSGILSFLLYCEWVWGQWNLYFEANRLGWGFVANPWQVFYPSYYLTFFEGNLSDLVGKLLVIVFVLGMGSLLRKEYKQGLSDRSYFVPLFAFILLFLGEVMFAAQMHALHRYALPIFFLGIPLWTQSRHAHSTPHSQFEKGLPFFVWVACFILQSCQCLLIQRFYEIR